MTALTEAVAIGDVHLNIDTAFAQGSFPGYVKIDSEVLHVGGVEHRNAKLLTLSRPATATHNDGATVTYAGNPYDADFLANVGGGGGGVTPPLTLTGEESDQPVVAVQAAPGQTADTDEDPFYVANADGDKVLRVRADDNVYIEAYGEDAALRIVNRNGATNLGAFLLDMSAQGDVTLGSDNVAANAVAIQPLVALDPGWNIFNVRPSSGNRWVAVSHEGYLKFRSQTEPDDANLANNELAFWFDSTNGAAKLMIKGKTANGTVVTGEVALT